MNFFSNLLAFITLIALSGIVLLYFYFSYGFLILNFWDWFVLPVFPSLPTITLAQAIGLSLVISLFKGSSKGLKKEFNYFLGYRY